MFLATINKPEQILYFCYIGQVGIKDLQRNAKQLEEMLAELAPEFRVLADLSRLEAMDIACVPEIGKTMETLERYRVGLIVRVIPDPSKDIGFNIISAFHYKNRPHTATCRTMEEAAALLALKLD
jgi:hypothetical protein